MGATNYENYTLVDSIMIPYRLDIHAILPGGIEILMHKVIVEEVRFDTIQEDEFRPDSTLQGDKGKK